MTHSRPVIPELREMPLTFLDCDKQDHGCGVNIYCLAWIDAGYSGNHPTCEAIRNGTVEKNIHGVPYFKCLRGFAP